MPYFDGDKFNPTEYKNLVEGQFCQFSADHNNHALCDCSGCSVIKFASERIHTLILQENGLRHNRITWFANIEGFLWLSYAAVISQDQDQDNGWEDEFWLLIVIPIIGIFVCLSAISQFHQYGMRMLPSNYSSRSGELYKIARVKALML